MFHTWPVKISRIAPISNPSCRVGKSATMASMTGGKKLSTGNGLQNVEHRDHEGLTRGL